MYGPLVYNIKESSINIIHVPLGPYSPILRSELLIKTFGMVHSEENDPRGITSSLQWVGEGLGTIILYLLGGGGGCLFSPYLK
mgnify:CR=1 FL=1